MATEQCVWWETAVVPGAMADDATRVVAALSPSVLTDFSAVTGFLATGTLTNSAPGPATITGKLHLLAPPPQE